MHYYRYICITYKNSFIRVNLVDRRIEKFCKKKKRATVSTIIMMSIVMSTMSTGEFKFTKKRVTVR